MIKSVVDEVLSNLTLMHKGYYTYIKPEKAKHQHDLVIICPRHGKLPISVRAHQQGVGCYACFGKNNVNIATVIQSFQELWGDFFDYSETQYEQWTNKVKIKCVEHGDFAMKPSTHLKGRACLKCMSDGVTPQVAKLLGRQGANYYSKHLVQVAKEYGAMGLKKKISNCYMHGIFEYEEQAACPKCAILFSGHKESDATAYRKHETTVSPKFSLLGDGSGKADIKILSCAIHNIVRPKSHPNEKCPYCIRKHLNTETLKEELLLIYGNQYGLDKLVFVNHKTPVTIICKEHGEVEVSHRFIRKGYGCPLCNPKTPKIK